MKNLADQMDHALKKRKRTVLTAKQHQVLIRAFEEFPFPDGEQRAVLGKSLNMSSRTVQIWFQNQRQKTKNTGDMRSSDLSNEEYENYENGDIDKYSDKYVEKYFENYDNARSSPFSQQRSLQILADAACIEYDKKFKSKDNKDM
jgi:hypothetical protein